MDDKRRSYVLFDLVLQGVLSTVFVSHCFKGATSACDGFIHLSKVKVMMDTLTSCGHFPRWNPYWYFGVPMWRIYSPLSYYIAAFLGWVFNFSMVDIVMAWTYLVFSIATVSTYLLAKELAFRRSGCFASSILFLTSGNLILYWGNGSYPNVTAVAFSPLALLLFLRAVKKRSFLNILAAGLSFSMVVLTYVMNALILSLFIAVVSIVLAIADPSLVYIPRDISKPPKYTLELPKVLIAILLIALVLSSWWALPFLKTYIDAPTIPEASSGLSEAGMMSFWEQLLRIMGVRLSRYELPFSPGIGHVVLALIGCGFAASKRKVKLGVSPLCLAVSFMFNLAPWLGIPTGYLFWWRFSLYFSLFAALSGGIAIGHLKDLYERFLNTGIRRAQNQKLVNVFYSTSVIMLTLLISVYQIVGTGEFIFPGHDLSIMSMPVDIGLLKSSIRPGERVGADGGLSYGLNLFSEIPQSGGGNVHYVYMVNEFAYIFWRYMFKEKDGGRLRYFARNYNVRWFIESEMPGLVRTHPDLPCEVEGFNSSFAELIGPSNNLVLYVGDEDDYSQLFLSVAASDPKEIILIYGGRNLQGYDLTTLRNFDSVYLAAWRGGSSEFSQSLTEYVESGGCVILDTGNLEYGGELIDIPDLFPIQKVAIDRNSYLMLNPVQHTVTMGIDFTKFGTARPYTVSYAESLKEGAVTLLYEQDRPVLVYWNLGLGKVFWTGLRLPYFALLNERETESKEGMRLLVNLLRYAVLSRPSGISLRFEQSYPEEIKVHVKNATSRDAVWVKMTYYPGWTAWVEDKSSIQLRIFRAGPDMMLVFPRRSGDCVVRLYFDKTLDVKLGESISLVGVIALPALAFYKAARHRFRSKET